MTHQKLNIDNTSIKKGAKALRAINHKLRQIILNWIVEKGNEAKVTEIYVALRLEQSVCSQHLAILRREGFVKTKREGKFILYSVDFGRMDEVNNICKQLTQAK